MTTEQHIDEDVLEQIMDRMAIDDDFRSLLATKPYKALGDLGVERDQVMAIRDATLAGSETMALGDRASAAQTTWGKLMGTISGNTWCGCTNDDKSVITAYCN